MSRTFNGKTGLTSLFRMVGRDYAISNTARGHGLPPIYFNVQKQFTVNDIYYLLENQKLGNYRYDENKSGCLYWTTAFLCILETLGFVEPGSYTRLVQHVNGFRGAPGQTQWHVPRDQGRFIERTDLNTMEPI